jgi:hypothetical protein
MLEGKWTPPRAWASNTSITTTAAATAATTTTIVTTITTTTTTTTTTTYCHDEMSSIKITRINQRTMRRLMNNVFEILWKETALT